MAFAQTMLLFMESILVLALWFSSGKLLWFFRSEKQKATNRVSSANHSKTAEESDEAGNDGDEEAVEYYKVMRGVCLVKPGFTVAHANPERKDVFMRLRICLKARRSHGHPTSPKDKN